MRKPINELILTDIFPDWLEGGIFKTLTSNHPVPWRTDIPDGSILDMEYYGNHSGNKIVAPLMYNLLDATTGEVPQANVNKLASLIWLKYGTNWTQLAKNLAADYDPIENYNMIETESGTNTSSSNGSNIRTGSMNSTKSGNVTNNNTQTGSTKTSNDMYAFNSTTAVPTTDSTTTIEGSGNTDNTTTTYNDVTDSTTYNSVTDTTTGGASGSNSRTLTRSGNIGVTTSAQMLEGHSAFWGDWSFFEQVFKDVDDILCTPTFGEGYKDWVEVVAEHQTYVLPMANDLVLGGVKVVSKTDAMTEQVGIDATGHLWSVPGEGGTGAVSSVNGRTGNVVLNAADVHALPDTTTVPTQLSQLTADATHRTVTDTEKNYWNEKLSENDVAVVATSGLYSDLEGLPTIPSTLSELTSDATHRTVTDDQINTWNNPPQGEVSSVNGQTGAVVLDAGDLDVDMQETYSDGTVGKEIVALNTSLTQSNSATLIGQETSPSTVNTLVTVTVNSWQNTYNALYLEVGTSWGWTYGITHYKGTRTEKRLYIGSCVVDIRVSANAVTFTAPQVIQGDSSGLSDKIKVYGIK